MPIKSGIDVIQELEKIQRNEVVILVTAYDNLAIQSFSYGPFQIIRKERLEEDLPKAVSRFLKMRQRKQEVLEFQVKGEIIHTKVSDIVYFESDRKHIKIICSDGTEKMFVGKLKELIDKLPFSYAMAAQSFVINIRHVKICKKNSCIMDNGTCINIGRKYKDAFNIKMIEYNKHGGNG